jgi:hypothetical protein
MIQLPALRLETERVLDHLREAALQLHRVAADVRQSGVQLQFQLHRSPAREYLRHRLGDNVVHVVHARAQVSSHHEIAELVQYLLQSRNPPPDAADELGQLLTVHFGLLQQVFHLVQVAFDSKGAVANHVRGFGGHLPPRCHSLGLHQPMTHVQALYRRTQLAADGGKHLQLLIGETVIEPRTRDCAVAPRG